MALSRRRFFGSTALAAGAAFVPSALLPRAAAAAAGPANLHDWEAVRGLFELSPDWVHASLFLLSSHPRPVREAVEKMRLELDANPAGAGEGGAFSPPEDNLCLRAAAPGARPIGACAGAAGDTKRTHPRPAARVYVLWLV